MKKAVGIAASFGFALAVIALLLTGWLSYENLRRISHNGGLVVHTHEVLDEMRDLAARLSEAESRERSYIITRQQLYLAPYRAAANAAARSVARVKQ